MKSKRPARPNELVRQIKHRIKKITRNRRGQKIITRTGKR